MPETVKPVSNTYNKEKADEIWALLTATAKECASTMPSKDLCDLIFGNSPFLATLAERHVVSCLHYLTTPPEAAFATLLSTLTCARPSGEGRQNFMAFLREQKAHLSLITAIADISGQWELMQVTEALSRFADLALELTVGHLLHEKMTKGDLLWPGGSPEHVTTTLGRDSGYFILGLGKLGANELNYSSDIDLIVLFEPTKIKYSGPKTIAQCMIKITQDLVTIMEQRTMHGYVFRTDLQLRPDPGATPVAISTEAAESYYHSMAVNWERSAMIKARVVAGDKDAGEQYLKTLSSWVWRRNVDYAALKDIAAIKNQINRHYDQDHAPGPGMNVKLGHGGIREIEFFVQVNQLLHAGRHPSLRLRRTLDGLDELLALQIISVATRNSLREAYSFLRQLEHRIQMLNDAQTHELPVNHAELCQVSYLMGIPLPDGLIEELTKITTSVSAIYDALLPQHSPGLNARFSETSLASTLSKLGFSDIDGAAAVVEGLRRGRYRALRTERSKALFEQCLPHLLEAFAGTNKPNGALLRFDNFVSKLPAGVQLFSLLQSNPSLFKLLARVMGLAPALADTLAKKPELWDMVLEPTFFVPIENHADLCSDLTARLQAAQDFQDTLDYVRKFVAEQKFRAGVHLLESVAEVSEIGVALTRIADVALQTLIPHVCEEFERRHGKFPDGGIAVLAMGKYGGAELTHTSDLDIVFLYHADNMDQTSNGAKPLSPSQYFSRLAQNIITSITALTPEGRLFEIDTRLRPSGSQGPLVVTLKTFLDYYTNSAWTWEHMALTRSRVILAPATMERSLTRAVQDVLTTPRDAADLLQAVSDMRQTLFAEFGTANSWAIKHCRGGLIDLEFICQYLMLREGHRRPELFEPALSRTLAALADAGIISPKLAVTLEEAHQFLQQTQSLLRLSLGQSPASGDDIPEGLKHILLRSAGLTDFAAYEQKLSQMQSHIYKAYKKLIETPAKTLATQDT